MDTIKDQLSEKVATLSENQQRELLAFAEFLVYKNLRDNPEQDIQHWSQFSLEQAMVGLENDNLPEYGEQDLKEKWQ